MPGVIILSPAPVQGLAADGAAEDGNPVLVGGTDGTNARSMRTATDGTVRIDPTGTTTQPISAASLPLPAGAATEATLALVKAKTDNLDVALSTRATEATLLTRTAAAQLPATLGNKARDVSLATIDAQPATYYAVYDRIVPAANKYMATLFNTSSTRKVVIQRIWTLLWQVATATGVVLEQELRFITARTAGTAVTPVAMDSADSLSAGITADHLSTAVTDSSLLRRIITANEEVSLVQGGPNVGSAYMNTLTYERSLHTKGLTLRQNQGLTIKNITSSTAGSVSYVIEFTDEVA